MTKKISLIQVNFQQGPEILNAYYLPYSVGCIWSYANSFKEIQENYQLDHVIWRRENVPDLAKKLCDQDIVVFSCYIWNRNYNYALAKQIKQLNPACQVVFGGPELPITDRFIFEKLPFIDVVVKKEGELTFKNFLLCPEKKFDLAGLMINQDGQAIDTGDASRIEDLSVLPSPYITGFFDPLVANHPEIEWMATLETNRGCPYQCTFCDWGSLTYSKIKQFPLDRVLQELAWISENRCGGVYVADANFGIFPQRDNLIVDRFVELQNQHGFPQYWGATWAKNQKREVIDIIKKLSRNTKFYNLGLNISLQSLTDEVLVNIKRKNMHDMTVKEMFVLADQMQQPTFTELILGLPGETLSSWQETFFKMLRADIHSFADVSVAQLLENAEMNLVQKQIYDIETREVNDYISGSYNDDDWPETISIVKATKDMPAHDMVSAMVFTWFMTTFHMQHFSSFCSRFLFKHRQIDYKVFYDRLFGEMLEHSWFVEQKRLIESAIESWYTTGRVSHPDLSNGVKIHSWNIWNATAMKIHLEDRYDTIFSVIEKTLHSFKLPKDLADEVMCFQRLQVIDLHRLHSYPRVHRFNHNIFDFVVHEQALKQIDHELVFDFKNEKKAITKEYIERISLSRKTNFTKSIVAKIKSNEDPSLADPIHQLA